MFALFNSFEEGRCKLSRVNRRPSNARAHPHHLSAGAQRGERVARGMRGCHPALRVGTRRGETAACRTSELERQRKGIWKAKQEGRFKGRPRRADIPRNSGVSRAGARLSVQRLKGGYDRSKVGGLTDRNGQRPALVCRAFHKPTRHHLIINAGLSPRDRNEPSTEGSGRPKRPFCTTR